MTQSNTTRPNLDLSILDALENTGQQNSVPGSVPAAEVFEAALENIRELQSDIRKCMDAGLPPAEMVQARSVAEGAQAAEIILDKLRANSL